MLRAILIALAVTLVASQSTVTVTNGTSGPWTDANLWTGNVVPATSVDVILAGGGQLNVGSSVNALNFGVQGGSTLNVQSAGTLAVVGTVTLTQGNVAVATGGSFTVTGSVLVKSGATAAQEVRGPGTVTVNTGQVTVESGATLVVTGSAMVAASNGVSVGGAVVVRSGTSRLPSPIQLTAASSSFSVAGDATLSLNAPVTFSGAGETFIDGTVLLTGASSVSVAAGNKFNVRGGILSFTGSSASTHMVIGDGSATGSSLTFVSSSNVAGMQGSYQVNANSEVRIKTGASARTQVGTTRLDGKGKMFIESGATLRAEGTTTINIPITNAGSISFYAGQQINVNDISQTSDASRLSFEALTSGFVVVNAGHVDLNGNVAVSLGQFQPTTKVAIMQCTLITGRFQRQQITKNNGQNAKGAVQIEGYAIYYDPQGDPNNPVVNPAAGFMLAPSLLVAVLSILAALFGRQL